ncbi:MAG: cytochrome b N-terminal domain-containing protein [Candidatus Thermoplasmatota archaeon]|nr:cytochrome b N-terminal domain-containing protein [Candidatus Thermoplasmatota archaeon]
MAEERSRVSGLIFRMGSIFTRSRDWIISRSGLEEMIKETEEKKVPKHALNPMFCLGGVTLVALILLGLTGLFLDSYYEPSDVEEMTDVSRAKLSIQRIVNEVPFGFYVKSVHSWAANVMVITILLHTLRVFATGSYKNPRELTWLIGVLLLVFTFTFLTTGYVLLDDARSQSVVTTFSDLIYGIRDLPVIGGAFEWLSAWANDLFIGSPITGEGVLVRAHWIHTTALPLVTLVILLGHFYLIRKHGISGPL